MTVKAKLELFVASKQDRTQYVLGHSAMNAMTSRIRSFLLFTHRWIGLLCSLVLSIIGVTGAIMLLPGNPPLRQIAGPLHERLGLGHLGWWIVVVVTFDSPDQRNVFLCVAGPASM
jgi:hypothetical protein